MAQTDKPHTLWLGRWGFFFAATGSAVGLGNIWKFPYMTGENGGGAFVLIYLVCILLVGIPLMMTEIMMGRRGRSNPIDAVRKVAIEGGASPLWRIVGMMSMLSGFLILTFYAVIAGWSFEYVLTMASGQLSGASPELVGQTFGQFLESPGRLLIWDTLIVVITMTIVGLGVQGGVERNVGWMMPGMVVLLIAMVIYAGNSGGFIDGLTFLFAFDFSKITPTGILSALGHAFFTLSLAAGAIIAYGAYLPQDKSIVKTTLTVAFADTAIALLAGMAIFPIVFANGLETGSGPGLLFVTLPTAFAQMPFGSLFGTIFFVMLVLAALTSSISMVEASMAMVTERFGWSRPKAAVILGLLVWLMSLGTIVSFNIGADWKLFGRTIFENIDYLTANLLMPLGGLLMAILAAWILPRKITANELNMGNTYTIWLWVLRLVTPTCIVLIFAQQLGLIQFS